MAPPPEIVRIDARQRPGRDGQTAPGSELIPWEVRAQHRMSYVVALLRVEARRRGGGVVRDSDSVRLVDFAAELERTDQVVHYDPESDEGWQLVPRRHGIDHDLIREPTTDQ